MTSPLPDDPARRLVESLLDENLLVEAGAGSGKTTSLVGRMVALVRDAGVEVERMAAVTFTRKAAGELRERFQGRLEEARRDAPEGVEAQRLDRALHSMDRAFMGTIHAFCARLLRERPLEAGLDPAFRELTAQEAVLLSRRWWNAWLERLATDGDPALGRLAEVGISPHRLQHAFETLGEHTDVHFPAPEVPRPSSAEVAAVRSELEDLMATADRIFPDREPEKGWDPLQDALRTAWFCRRALDWEDDRVFLDVLARVHGKAESITQNRWASDGHLTPKVLKDRFEEWAGENSRATRLVRGWLAHRYPVALGFARRAAREFAAFRHRTGQLSFHDLLVVTAELLRRSPGARSDLGRRYTRLLVDEFQDTDPLQAEILFLLTSDPDRDGPGDWTETTPRPGALFVVGDPKQSIYRFRRADIALYQQVRERFEAFGRVVRLTANFRSRPAIGDLVDHVFGAGGLFPQDGSEHQAAFAPLEAVRDATPPERTVTAHDIPPCDDADVHWAARPSHERRTEALALAAWVAARVRSGERRPGDFLILTRWKRGVDLYARALEARNLPVEVSGAGVGIEEELAELRRLLSALADPDDAVLTVAALTGLFFGLDLDTLLRYREAATRADEHRPFDFRGVPPDDEGGDGDGVDAVRSALATLHRWWRLARREPADLVVQALVDELGLLPWAAAGELGQVRAGALAFALDAVRSAGLQGDTSLVGALDALETMLGDEEVEAPLEPGRRETVRVMNLHKAKGLEAPVVILADPHPHREWPTRLVVERDPGGAPSGWLRIGEPGRWAGQFEDLAKPLEWDARHEAEQLFEEAEEARLLYVAATRAGDELVVGRVADAKRAARSPWSPLHGWIDERAGSVRPEPEEPGPREHLEVSPEEMARRVEETRRRRREAGRAGYSFDTVTALLRAGGSDRAPLPPKGPSPPEEEAGVSERRLGWDLAEADATGPGGYEWGNAVHTVLEAAARGLGGDALRAAARTALLENDRPVRDDEPVELDVLLELVDRVRASELWRRSREAGVRLSEQPFVLEEDDGRYLEGVIDLVFREEDGWVVVDYKTDRGDDPDFEARMERYRAQVATYARSWARITGEPVVEALVWTLRAPESDAGGSGGPGSG